MTAKADIRKEWLQLAMALYDAGVGNEAEQRALFERTCRAASARFTARELQWAINDMQYWLNRAKEEKDA